MADPLFVDFGAVNTFPAPYLAESAELHGFFVEADHARLSALCQRVFREPTGGAVDYRPLGSHVLLGFARIKKICPQTPPFDTWGTLHEDEVVVWVPVAAVDDRGDVMTGGDPAMFVPYVWLEDPLSIASGREVQGWPKTWGKPTFSKPGAPLDLRLQVYAWHFGPGRSPRKQQLLRIEEGGTPEGEEESLLEDLGDLLGGFWSSLFADGWMIPNLEFGLDVLTGAFRRQLPQVFLKQIRSADNPDTAVVQQVVSCPSTIQRISGRPLLGDHHLTIRYFDSCPIVKELGIESQTTRLGFRVEMDFVQEQGQVLWDAAWEHEIVIPEPDLART